MHLATFSPEEWPLTMDISNSNNIEHPGRYTGQTWSNISSSHDIDTQWTAVNILISQGPNGYSLLEEWPLTRDLSNSNYEEHPGRYNRSNLNSLFSKQGTLCTRHSSEYHCTGYTVHRKYPWKGYTIQAQAANILEAGYMYANCTAVNIQAHKTSMKHGLQSSRVTW